MSVGLYTATITKINLQRGTDRTVYVEWTCNLDHIDHYEVRWWYKIELVDGSQVGIRVDPDATTTSKYITYNAPADALWVTCYVKPVSKTYKDSKGNDIRYWNGEWSNPESYKWTKHTPIDTPSAPSVSIRDLKLTASVDNLDSEITEVKFQVVKNNSDKTYKSDTVRVRSNQASCEFDLASGGTYKVRCRYYDSYGGVSEWSPWSGEEGTPPPAPSKITRLEAKSENSVYLEWSSVTGATFYDVEYTTELRYFDKADDTTTVSDIKDTCREITGLESGDEYFFRVRAGNDSGRSPWSGVRSISIGTIPIAPTTWSSTTTAIVGEPITLNWIHNSEDGSAQSSAKLEIIVKQSKTDPGTTLRPIVNTEGQDDDEKTMFYDIDTSGYTEGATIQWRVCTAGALLNQYGDWSIQRTIDVYAKPSLSIVVTDPSDNEIDTIRSFPFFINGEASPSTQIPTSYHVTIKSNSFYETIDFVGNHKAVKTEEIIYSKYINSTTDLNLRLSAGDIDLQNGVTYTITCVVSMNSGLTAEDSRNFIVSWVDDDYWPNTEIYVNSADASVSLRPYCRTTDGNEATDVTMSVYRREFDGSFTELTTGLDPTKGTFITDPHPSLDYARYRIVSVSNATGAISYFDMPPYPIGEKAVIIQWDETWSNFDYMETPWDEPAYSSSLLKLQYNIDVTEDYTPSKSLIEYIGRSHPVSYYGTQKGVSASWNVTIPKKDKETIYALRRLAAWMGDVYVREPSGVGYWANITVSFSQKHLDTTIPVSLNITRVSGGV